MRTHGVTSIISPDEMLKIGLRLAQATSDFGGAEPRRRIFAHIIVL